MKAPATLISLKSLTALSALGIVLASGSGCTSAVSNNETHQPILRMEPVYIRPDIAVSSRKISGKSTVDRFFTFDAPRSLAPRTASSACKYVEPELFNGLSSTQADALREAIFRACEDNHVEYLIAPHYLIKTTRFPLLSFIWTSSECTVYGFPAIVKSVSTVKDKDEAHVELSVSTTKEKSDKSAATISSGKSGK